MTVKEIKTRAEGMGINPGKMKKVELIQTIQKVEGNTPCFGTNGKNCGQDNCLWRDDCLKA